jgi:hypothetical protein
MDVLDFLHSFRLAVSAHFSSSFSINQAVFPDCRSIAPQEKPLKFIAPPISRS